MSQINLVPAPFQIGGITVQQIVEMQFPFLLPGVFLPTAPGERLEQLRPQFEPWALCPLSGKLIIAVQTYALRTRHHTILVDTCVGCNKHSPMEFWHRRTDDGWLTRLAAAGIRIDEVDYVFCTHLHGDHIGWNTRLLDGRFVPTFPNARYIFAATEVEHARNAEEARQPAWQESVLPILEAGQAQLVDTDFALDDEVWLSPSPGHTPGHVCVHISSAGQQAILTGDVIHSPLQCKHPEWSARPDIDKSLAADTRRQVLADNLETNRLMLSSHFPLPSIGHVVADGDTFGFDFIK